jgi:hypothetical protein
MLPSAQNVSLKMYDASLQALQYDINLLKGSSSEAAFIA